jgi:hypothetical protein
MSKIVFTYVFLGLMLWVGCALNSVKLPLSPGITVEEHGGTMWISSEAPIDCGRLHERIEALSPFICAPWDDGRDFNYQQQYRVNLRRLYKKFCRQV